MLLIITPQTAHGFPCFVPDTSCSLSARGTDLNVVMGPRRWRNLVSLSSHFIGAQGADIVNMLNVNIGLAWLRRLMGMDELDLLTALRPSWVNAAGKPEDDFEEGGPGEACDRNRNIEAVEDTKAKRRIVTPANKAWAWLSGVVLHDYMQYSSKLSSNSWTWRQPDQMSPG